MLGNLHNLPRRIFSQRIRLQHGLGELESDWSIRFLESHDLVRDYKVTKPILAHTPTLGQYDVGYHLKIVLLNFTKLSVRFKFIEFEHYS